MQSDSKEDRFLDTIEKSLPEFVKSFMENEPLLVRLCFLSFTLYTSMEALDMFHFLYCCFCSGNSCTNSRYREKIAKNITPSSFRGGIYFCKYINVLKGLYFKLVHSFIAMEILVMRIAWIFL